MRGDHMKVPIKERISDFILFLIRPIVYFIMSRELKVVHEGDHITKDREAFILISNHFNTWDAFVIAKYIKRPIRFVATEIAYLDLSKKLGMGLLARTIRKRVGKSDMRAMKQLFQYLKMGYVVGLFPEGDNTFTGSTIGIYENTGRLLQKANVDVVMCKQKGGYLSQPRWADYFSKTGVVYTNTYTLIKKEDLMNYTPEEINRIVEEALKHNEYEFQKNQRINFHRQNRAEGIERVIYRCNKCDSTLSVFGEGNNILCSKCGTIGYINEMEWIEGNEFSNIVDYNQYQYSKIEDVIKSEFMFVVTLNIVDTTRLRNKKLGQYKLHYKNKVLTLTNNKSKIVFELEKMKYPVNTMRHSFSFDYGDLTYNFTDIRHQFVLYEMCRYVNGSYKRKKVKQ
jgi:hypothetical protein